MNKGKKMTKRYQNKEWLHNKYWKEKLSTTQIAKLCGMSQAIIRYWLKRYNILCRFQGEAEHLIKANHCNLTQESIEWLNGELLGDACLRSRSSYSARIKYGSKYLEYIKYVSNTLQSFGVEQSGKIKRYYDKRFGFLGSYQYVSLSYPEFLLIYKRWYPDGKKIVPKDIELTPLTCRQWYIGDGGLQNLERARSRVQLATCGFGISDIEWLIKKLIDLGFKATRQASNNIISISLSSSKAFLDYIGKCPVSCYQYKWNYQDNRRILV